MSHEHPTSDYKRTNRKLFKNPDKAKICGVCAGLSEYFDLETWVVRLIAVSFFLFSGGTALIAYFVACFIMETKPGSKSNKGCFGNNKQPKTNKSSEERQYQASVKDVWRKGSAPTDLLHKAENKFSKMERQLQAMETYITSNQYQLEKEFEKIV